MNKKKERWTKTNFSRLVFSTLKVVTTSYGVDLLIERQWDVVCKLFVFFCFVFVELLLYCMFIREAILNLPYPYLRSTTLFLDDVLYPIGRQMCKEKVCKEKGQEKEVGILRGKQ